MNKKLEQLILSRRFEEAKQGIKGMDMEELEEFLLVMAFDTYSIIIYTFVCDLISDSESAELHYIASILLSQPLCHIEGAYSASLYHAKKAVDLSPDIGLEEYLLFFYDIPEKLLSKEEAKEIAKEVLKKKPDSIIAALQILNDE